MCSGEPTFTNPQRADLGDTPGVLATPAPAFQDHFRLGSAKGTAMAGGAVAPRIPGILDLFFNWSRDSHVRTLWPATSYG